MTAIAASFVAVLGIGTFAYIQQASNEPNKVAEHTQINNASMDKKSSTDKNSVTQNSVDDSKESTNSAKIDANESSDAKTDAKAPSSDTKVLPKGKKSGVNLEKKDDISAKKDWSMPSYESSEEPPQKGESSAEQTGQSSVVNKTIKPNVASNTEDVPSETPSVSVTMKSAPKSTTPPKEGDDTTTNTMIVDDDTKAGGGGSDNTNVNDSANSKDESSGDTYSATAPPTQDGSDNGATTGASGGGSTASSPSMSSSLCASLPASMHTITVDFSTAENAKSEAILFKSLIQKVIDQNKSAETKDGQENTDIGDDQVTVHAIDDAYQSVEFTFSVDQATLYKIQETLDSYSYYYTVD